MSIEKSNLRPRDIGITPIVVRPRGAKTMLGNCSDDELYDLIRKGELESFLDGRRRLITVESIKAHIARGLAAAKARGFERASGARRPRETT